MGVQRSGWKALLEEWRAGGDFAFVLVFVTVGGDKIRAIRWASDCDFTLGATADGANLFALGGAETPDFSFLANWTRQNNSSREPVRRIPCATRNAKSTRALTP